MPAFSPALFENPSSSLGLRMDDNTVRVAIGLRLGLPLCSPHTCRSCGDEVGANGLHGLSCRFSEGRHYRAVADLAEERKRRKYNDFLQRFCFSPVAFVRHWVLSDPNLSSSLKILVGTSTVLQMTPSRTSTCYVAFPFQFRGETLFFPLHLSAINYIICYRQN